MYIKTLPNHTVAATACAFRAIDIQLGVDKSLRLHGVYVV